MDVCWLLFDSSVFHFPQPTEQLPLPSKPAPGEKEKEQWGLAGSVGGGADLEGRQRETEIHCRCQAPQIVRSKNPPNADFYQGSGLAQRVRVSIWKGCASAVQIFPRFLRLVQVSMGQSEFDEEGKGSICQLDLIYRYQDKKALLCFPQSWPVSTCTCL